MHRADFSFIRCHNASLGLTTRVRHTGPLVLECKLERRPGVASSRMVGTRGVQDEKNAQGQKACSNSEHHEIGDPVSAPFQHSFLRRVRVIINRYRASDAIAPCYAASPGFVVSHTCEPNALAFV